MTMKPSGEARPLLNIAVQTEINRNENKRYPVVKRQFQPNFQVRPVAGKFYAKHDYPDPDLLDEALVDAIERWKVKLPENKSPDPETSNQEYGWYNDPFIEFNGHFHHPKIGSFITRIGAIIAKEDEKNPKKLFTGIPFKI